MKELVSSKPLDKPQEHRARNGDCGFERKQYSKRVEQAFDQAFDYKRPLIKIFCYAHTMQHSTLEEGAASRVQAIQEQRQVALLIVAEQQLVHQYLAQPNSISTQQRVMQLEPEQAKIDERQGIRGPKL